MVLLDVNVLVYAFREDCQDHKKYRDWLEDALNGGRVAVSELVLSGVLRIATHPKIFRPPTPLAQALGLWKRYCPIVQSFVFVRESTIGISS